MGDPDQNVYEWRFAFSENIQKFFQKIEDLEKRPISRYSLSQTFRLHDQLRQLALKFLKSEHNQITYPSIRNERFKKQKIQQQIKSNERTNMTERDHEIALEVYSDEWEEIRMIVERIYEAKYVKNKKFSEMAILMRTTKKKAKSFIEKLRFAAKQFEKQKADKQQIISIPLLVLGSTSMFKDASAKFILALLKYYSFIHGNKLIKKEVKHEEYQESDSDEEEQKPSRKSDQKKVIIRKLCKHVRGTITKDQIGIEMLSNKSMTCLLQEDKFKKIIEQYPQKSPKIAKLNQFRQDMLNFIQKCESEESPKQILEYVIKTFYQGEIYKDLEKNQFVEELYQIATLHEDDSVSQFTQGLILQKDAYDSTQKIEKVFITTMHQAKGLTFSIVFMPSMNQNFEGFGDDDDDIVYIEDGMKGPQMKINEEFRVHFTAITRSKNSLFISRTKDTNQQNCTFSGSIPRRQFQILSKILELKQKRLDESKQVCINKIKERYFENLRKKTEKKNSRAANVIKTETKPPQTEEKRKKNKRQAYIKLEDEERREKSEANRESSLHFSQQDQNLPQKNQQTDGKKQRIRKKRAEKNNKREEKVIIENDEQKKKQNEEMSRTNKKNKNSQQLTLDSFLSKGKQAKKKE